MQGLQAGAELLIAFAVPDFVKGSGKQITQDDTLIIAGGKRRDATRQDVAVHRHIGHCPRSLAGTPRGGIGLILGETSARVGRARGFQPHPEILAQAFTFGDDLFRVFLAEAIQRLILARQADGVTCVIKYQPLELNFTDTQAGGQPHQVGQLGDILFHAGAP